MFDEEIEKVVLFYMIFEQADFNVDEKDFVSDRNKKIIEAINQLKVEKSEISILSIAGKIRGNNTQIIEYISELGEYIFGMSADIAYNKLIEYSKKRRVYELMEASKIDVINAEDMDNLIEKMVKQLNEIEERSEKSKSFLEQVINTMGEIERNYNQRSDFSLYMGLLDLDNILLGLHKQELTIIGARPGVGKTTLALQIGEYIARKGLNVGIVSLEMSETQLIQKMIARIGQVNSYKLRAGTLEDNDFMRIAKICGDLEDLRFCITSKIRTIQEIEVFARKLKNKGKLDLLVIDYIQLIKNGRKFHNREQEVADISRTLKLLSLELEIPIVGLCQLNRNANRNEPSLADLRESGAIEQDADNVIFLYQEEGQEEAKNPIVIAKVAKQRAGSVGKVRLLFKKENSEFCTLLENGRMYEKIGN